MSHDSPAAAHQSTNPLLAIVVAVVGALTLLAISAGLAAFLNVVSEPLPFPLEEADSGGAAQGAVAKAPAKVA